LVTCRVSQSVGVDDCSGPPLSTRREKRATKGDSKPIWEKTRKLSRLLELGGRRPCAPSAGSEKGHLQVQLSGCGGLGAAP